MVKTKVVSRKAEELDLIVRFVQHDEWYGKSKLDRQASYVVSVSGLVSPSAAGRVASISNRPNPKFEDLHAGIRGGLVCWQAVGLVTLCHVRSRLVGGERGRKRWQLQEVLLADVCAADQNGQRRRRRHKK
jgi:hypothetical protein